MLMTPFREFATRGKRFLLYKLDNLKYEFNKSFRKPVLVVFGGGSSDFHAAARRLKTQAKKSNKFGKVFAFTEKDLKKRHPKFYLSHREFIESNVRGFGLWIWKPYLINWAQHKCQENRLIIYLDAGCYLNLVTEGAAKRFDEYLKHAWDNDILAFQMRSDQFAIQGFTDLRELAWSRTDLFEELNLSSANQLSTQIEANVIFIRNNSVTKNFTSSWFSLMENNNYRFTKAPSTGEQTEEYLEHRFDQSVFSALYKSFGFATIHNENWFFPNWFTEGANYPIWTVRQRSG